MHLSSYFQVHAYVIINFINTEIEVSGVLRSRLALSISLRAAQNLRLSFIPFPPHHHLPFTSLHYTICVGRMTSYSWL
jgi:hypothetical protein